MKVTDPKFAAVSPVSKPSTDAPVRSVAPVEKVSTVQSEAVSATIAQVRKGLPVDRSQRIQEIAQQVKKGQFSPNPQQIAERIVDQAELEARLRSLLNK